MKKWSINKIKEILPKLPNTKGYQIKSKKYINAHQKLSWTYTDTNGHVYSFKMNWGGFYNCGYRFHPHWTFPAIKRYYKKLPNTKRYTLLKSKYKNVNTPLNWKYYDYNNKIHYFKTCWYNFLHGVRFYHEQWNITKIKRMIPKLKNSKRYTLLSDKYYGCNKPLKWRYIDTNNESHYFNMSWANFKQGNRYYKRIHYKLNIKKIKQLIKKLPNTRGYKLNSLKFINSRKKMSWTYTDKRGIKHYFKMSWGEFKNGHRWSRHWTLPKIRKCFKKLPNVKGFFLPNQKYKNPSTKLLWGHIDKNNKISYFKISWYAFKNGQRHNKHLVSVKYINNRILRDTNTTGYTLLSKQYKDIHSPLWWRYIDKNNKVHYFQMSWSRFGNNRDRFLNTSIKQRDIVQEVYDHVNNRYSVLCITFDKSHNPSQLRMLIRHNSSKCNYYTYWTKVYGFLYGYHCPVCSAIKRANKVRFSNHKILNKVFNQWDNHDHKYIPDLSNYKNQSLKLKWIYKHKNGIVTHFLMSLDAFYQGCRPTSKNNRNEKYFEYLLNNYFPNYKKLTDYYHSYKVLSNNKKHGSFCSFDFYFPNILANGLVIELNGIQHIKAVNWSGKMTQSQLKYQLKYQHRRDKRKSLFCQKNHIKLFWIPCYYNEFKNGIKSWGSWHQVKRTINYYFFSSIYPILQNNKSNREH